ncbi:alpha-tectorin-like [Clupea harengus]|uniref:Alpha-tectorin-like n=1 Tax=Clupea harengus TaxID=7950 RepID=A0A6P8H2I0_CLUHA|nr:alpha-tectorin-like [Clupea harengus]
MDVKALLCVTVTLLLCGHSSAGPAVFPTQTGTCWAMGDPHFRTFDGYFYNFMGNCSYTMAKNCDIDYHHPPFEVEVTNKVLPDTHLTAVSEVTIHIYSLKIQMIRSELGTVKVNGQVWSLPASFDNGLGTVKLMQSGLSVVMWVDFGMTVQYDWQEYVSVTMPSGFMGKVCGLCGNFNMNKDDDLAMSNGTLVKSVTEMGQSWRVQGVKGEDFCTDECTGECAECSFGKRLAADMFCGMMTPILDLQFRDCHALIDPSIFFDMCKFDHCRGGGLKDYLCRILQVYTDACQRAGMKVHDWRHLARCDDPDCPAHSHFEPCGSACTPTCVGNSTCDLPCVQACICDKGYIRSGNKCVSKTELCLDNTIVE